MLRNPMDANEVRNPQHFPKNNFFCYRWRILDNFNKSIDRQMFHLSVQGADNHRSLMSDKFLQLYKSRYNSSRKDLIVDLAQDAIKFLNRRRQEHYELSKVEVMLSKAAQQLIDRVFNTLLSFSTELNSVLGLSELFITATEPEVKKRGNSSETSIALYIQAHLSTSLFRLVIEGRQEHICFYLIPADNIMAIHDLARQYEPVTAWEAQLAPQNHVYWLSPAGVLTEEMIDVACAELLRHLIETTQESIVPGSMASVERDYRSFDMMEADPWILEETNQNVSAQLEPTAKLNKSAPSLSCADGKWNFLDQVAPVVVSDKCASSHICERGSFSLTVSTGNEIDTEQRAVELFGKTEDKPFTRSCDGTITDSVPSLASLFKESGVFTTAPDEVPQPQFNSEPNEFKSQPNCDDTKPSFDLTSAYFEDAAPKRKGGVSTKRSNRKAAAKKTGRNQVNKQAVTSQSIL